MKVTLESTTKVVELLINDAAIPARIWQGKTDSGVEVHAYITRIAHKTNEPAHVRDEFERELEVHAAPIPELAVIPARMIL